MSKTLQYAATKPRPPKQRGWPGWGTPLVIVMSTIILAIMITIEALNAAAGGVLPRNDYGQWRSRHSTTPAAWRHIYGPRDAQGKPVQRALTNVEVARMQREVAEARAQNNLLDAVSSIGLLQYLFVPAGLFLSVVLLFESMLRGDSVMRAVALGGCVTAVLGGFFMLERGYFTSLGW